MKTNDNKKEKKAKDFRKEDKKIKNAAKPLE